MQSRFKLFSDPVHGFVSAPRGLILDLIETPTFQRLRRIRQLGLGFLVYPGAVHTRFEHGLGAMALMYEVLNTLRDKGTEISGEEFESALAAALLHDIGHGPFSHTLEAALIGPAADETPHNHERMSRVLIRRLDGQLGGRLGGRLGATLEIFDGAYERPFFHALVASQIDMDRLDYLRRDSFYTGVAEGVVGVDRILKTMRVLDGRIVIEAKGAYAIEQFILSRRLMYWQVYLHKTVISADRVLMGAVTRARATWGSGDPALAATAPALAYFLSREVSTAEIDRPEVLAAFIALDDSDVLYSLKRWRESRDPILSDLSRRFLNRELFRTTFRQDAPPQEEVEAYRTRICGWLVRSGLSTTAQANEDAGYYLTIGVARHDAYQPRGEAIAVLERDGRLSELSAAENVAAVHAMVGEVEKPYVCAPKEVI